MDPWIELANKHIEQVVDQVLFLQPLPFVTRLTRALPIVTSPGERKNRWILFIHLHTFSVVMWIKNIHSGRRRQGQQLSNYDGRRKIAVKLNI
jgi:hypothetical protein